MDKPPPSELVTTEHCEPTASVARGCPPPTPEENRRNWAAWYQAMELSHEMLLMGLRNQIGPEGDLMAAYREWYQRYQETKWESRRAP